MTGMSLTVKYLCIKTDSRVSGVSVKSSLTRKRCCWDNPFYRTGTKGNRKGSHIVLRKIKGHWSQRGMKPVRQWHQGKWLPVYHEATGQRLSPAERQSGVHPILILHPQQEEGISKIAPTMASMKTTSCEKQLLMRS